MAQSNRLDEVTRLLGTDCVQTILRKTLEQPMSAAELTEACTASRATVYRRLEDLSERDLLEEQTSIDPDGHHRTVYTATLDRVVVDLTDDGFEVRITKRERAADRFTNFIEGLYDE